MQADNAFEPGRLVWESKETVVPARLTPKRVKTHCEAQQLFLKGPIPWRWLERAAPLSGKALALGLVLWFLKGLRKHSTVRLEPSKVRSLGLSRRQCYRALDALEQAGLVAVQRHLGSAPSVTIIVGPDESKGSEPD
jgi:hypothetical protein